MSSSCSTEKNSQAVAWVLWTVLGINLIMFLVELSFGLMSRSNALIADSMDMLGDSFIYATSLLVLSSTHIVKARVSLLKGVVMALLGLFVVYEIIQKILNPVVPDASIITAIGIIALIANLICGALLLRFRDNDLNIKSAWICSRNDAISSSSVILTGLLVGYFGSMWPDILIGIGISILVLGSSFGIIKESLAHSGEHND